MIDDECVGISDDYDSSPSQKRGSPQLVHYVGEFGGVVEFRNGKVRVVRACEFVDEFCAPLLVQECVLTVQDEDGPVRRMRDAKPPANSPGSQWLL
jgi:hypothetical protein